MLVLIPAPALCVSAQEDKADSASLSKITRETVSQALAGLTADGAYEFGRDEAEDPSWLLYIKNWMKRIDDMWTNSPMAGGQVATFSAIGALLVIILVISALALVMTRIFGGERRRFLLAGKGKNVEDPSLLGDWVAGGAQKALEYASGGKIKEATSILFRTLLQGLDNAGWIRFRKGRGSRAYLRQLRRSEQLYPLFRDFLWRFELAYYRKGTPGTDDWEILYGCYQDLFNTAKDLRPPAYMRKA